MDKICFSSLESNSQKLDGGAMFGNAPRPMWERWIAPDELGRIPLSCRCMLVEFNSTKILFETGIGAFFEPKMAERFGVQTPDRHILLEELTRINLKQEDIDYVVLSHLHFDHAGGLLPTYKEIQEGNNQLLFPNAKYIVGKEAWNRAKQPHSRDKASFIDGLCDKLEASGRLQLVDDSTKLFDGRLSFFETHGHTPGQLHSVFKGLNEEIIFCGDLIPGRHWVHIPITMGYDRFPEKLIEEKSSLYKRQDLKNTWFFFTHDNECSAAKIAFVDNKKYSATDTLNRVLRLDF